MIYATDVSTYYVASKKAILYVCCRSRNRAVRLGVAVSHSSDSLTHSVRALFAVQLTTSNCDQRQPCIPKLVTEGPRRPLVNLDGWEETASQYLGLPSDTLFEKTMNAVYDNDGRGYNWMPSQLKRLYAHHKILRSDIRPTSQPEQIELYLHPPDVCRVTSSRK